MNLFSIYQKLDKNYPKIDPHDNTWRLWLKNPKNQLEIFEVAIGTILVQNTNWKNVDQSISNLLKNGISTFETLNSLDFENLKELIKPSGFNNQKALYLLSLSEFFINQKSLQKSISRENLLSVKGIGKETADSILNYCLSRPVAIVGAYTKRFFARISGDIAYLSTKYEEIQSKIEIELIDSYPIGHFHALIVCHNQNLCQKKKPRCKNCFLKQDCYYGLNYLTDTDERAIKIQLKINPERKKHE